MPLPKDPKKLEEYKKKMSEIAKEKGYGKWMKGRKLSDEIKEKMSKTQIKLTNTPEEKKRRSERAKEKGYGKWMKGRKNQSLSETNKKRKGKTYREIYGEERAIEESTKRGMSNKGKKRVYKSDEARENVKTSKKREGKKYAEIYGEERAVEEINKRKETHRKKWRDKLRSEKRDKHKGDFRYNDWRKAVFERDNWTCQKCGVEGGRLQAHHIKQWARYSDLRYEVSNGITYCFLCHREYCKWTF